MLINGTVFFYKHKLLKPIVSWVGVQILLFGNKDQNTLISIFFHGFTICSIEVLFTIIQVWLQCCYFARNPCHCLILPVHVIVCDSHLWTALSYRNKDNWNLFLTRLYLFILCARQVWIDFIMCTMISQKGSLAVAYITIHKFWLFFHSSTIYVAVSAHTNL